MDNRWIINRPERVSRARKGAWGLVTLVAWLIFAWLLLPLITLALWAFGATTAYGSFATVLPSIEPELLLLMAWVALIMSTSLLAWAEFNRHRFRGHERRGPVASVPVFHLAAEHGVPAHVLDGLQHDRVITVSIDGEGWPVAMSLGAEDSPL